MSDTAKETSQHSLNDFNSGIVNTLQDESMVDKYMKTNKLFANHMNHLQKESSTYVKYMEKKFATVKAMNEKAKAMDDKNHSILVNDYAKYTADGSGANTHCFADYKEFADKDENVRGYLKKYNTKENGESSFMNEISKAQHTDSHVAFLKEQKAIRSEVTSVIKEAYEYFNLTIDHAMKFNSFSKRFITKYGVCSRFYDYYILNTRQYVDLITRFIVDYDLITHGNDLECNAMLIKTSMKEDNYFGYYDASDPGSSRSDARKQMNTEIIDSFKKERKRLKDSITRYFSDIRNDNNLYVTKYCYSPEYFELVERDEERLIELNPMFKEVAYNYLMSLFNVFGNLLTNICDDEQMENDAIARLDEIMYEIEYRRRLVKINLREIFETDKDEFLMIRLPFMIDFCELMNFVTARIEEINDDEDSHVQNLTYQELIVYIMKEISEVGNKFETEDKADTLMVSTDHVLESDSIHKHNKHFKYMYTTYIRMFIMYAYNRESDSIKDLEAIVDYDIPVDDVIYNIQNGNYFVDNANICSLTRYTVIDDISSTPVELVVSSANKVLGIISVILLLVSIAFNVVMLVINNSNTNTTNDANTKEKRKNVICIVNIVFIVIAAVLIMVRINRLNALGFYGTTIAVVMYLLTIVVGVVFMYLALALEKSSNDSTTA